MILTSQVESLLQPVATAAPCGSVDGDPTHSSEATKARRPRAGAEVIVEPIEGKPGYYASKFFLRPHYQLEGLTVSLRLVSKLPSAKGA